MPYIDLESRKQLWERGPMTAGELNYEITALIINYKSSRDMSYQIINDVLGALEGAKLEFYRRIVEPYEDRKINENGDVYDR